MNPPFRSSLGAIVFVLGLVKSPWAVAAQDFEDLTATVYKVPGCAPIDGDYGYSFQAKTMFSLDLVGKPTAKRAISYECKKERGTVYLYKYAGELELYDALWSAKHLIWGEESPSYHHPERIFLIDQVLVVVSTHRPKRMTEAILQSAKQAPEKGE